MSQAINYSKSIPLRHEVDVFVAGGGPAGFASALQAARQGLKVMLVEGQYCLGGMSTAGMVPAFMPFGDGVNFLSDGIGREIYTKLFKMGGCNPDCKTLLDPPGTVGFHHETLKRLYDTLLTEARVDFVFGTQMIDVMAKDGRVESVVCAAKSGIYAVKAKIYIDATGDGDLATWAGAPYEKGDEEGNLMPGTLCSLWSNIDWDTIMGLENRLDRRCLDQAFADKVFTVEDRHLSGMFRTGLNEGGGNIPHCFGVDATDERSVTEAIIDQRKRLLEYEYYYKNYLQGYEDMRLISTGSLLGIRETRRIMGDYVLNVNDFETRAIFEDEIGRCAYPVDIHPATPGDDTYKEFEKQFKERFRYQPGESYGIPYRCLTPKTLSNVLVAGRCLSADRYIQGSVRVIPYCYVMGQAVGVAAKLAIEHDNDTRGFKVGDLLKGLKMMGAYLPNA